MTTSTAAKIETHPPLARDAYGNLLAVPGGTCAWRISRETSGRPREIRGPDRQPIRFPLETTSDELVDLCGAGVYRIYALDQIGAQLADEHLAKWDLTPSARDLRNGGAEVLLGSVRPSGGTGAVTDLRFVLEAVTQMMRINSDALRIVTDSHVDLAKTLVAAKGLRNGVVPTTPTSDPSDHEEDDDDEEDERPTSSAVVELLMPIAQKAAELMPGFVMGKVMKRGSDPIGAKALVAAGDSSQPADAELAGRPFELRDLVDLAYAKRKGDAKRVKAQQQGNRAEAMASLQARIMADPVLVEHLLAIKQQLASDEIETLMNAVGGSTEPQQAEFIAATKSLPVDAAVEFCRDIVASIRNESSK